MINSDNKYSKMQKNLYEDQAKQWSINNRDPVVGSFDAHNSWEDYDLYLFKGLKDSKEKIALDFGCGPGRNIVKYYNFFKKIDGVDISEQNIKNAKIWLDKNLINSEYSKFYINNGCDLSCISENGIYDVIFSTICMQHICVYDIRYSLFSDFLRLLKPGGSIYIQMGFGGTSRKYVSYYDNNLDAESSNGFCDVSIENVNDLKSDLEKIGFVNFDFDLRETGPGDFHKNWIYFRANK